MVQKVLYLLDLRLVHLGQAVLADPEVLVTQPNRLVLMHPQFQELRQDLEFQFLQEIPVARLVQLVLCLPQNLAILMDLLIQLVQAVHWDPELQ